VAIIPYADVQNAERLPIDAQDVATRIRLVIAGTPGGTRDPARNATLTRETIPGPYETEQYFAVPAVYEYTSPEHSTYGCTRSLALPEGINPFLDPASAGIPEPFQITEFSNPGTPSAIRDGDASTYAQATLDAGQAIIDYTAAGATPATNWCGYKLRYVWTSGGSIGAEHLRRVQTNFSRMDPVETGAQRLQALRSHTLSPAPTLADLRDEYALSMQDARALPVNRDGETLNAITSVTFSVFSFESSVIRVHEFYPLVMNTELLEGIARANVRLPAGTPQRVTVTGVIPPDREHTITGWPGGDFTGVVAQHQYELGRTVIDFEQAGAPTGLPAEAVEAARERSTAITSEVQSAGYSVKMGQRR